MAWVYSNITNLKGYMPEKVIIQLTDDHKTGSIDENIVNNQGAMSDNFIDSFLRGRYPADMTVSEVPEMITDISTKLTAYNLYRRKLITVLPEPLKLDYKMCVEILKGIQSGKVTPFEEEDEPVIIIGNKTSDSKTFNSTRWSKYYSC